MSNWDFDYTEDGIIYYFELEHGVGIVKYTNPKRKRRKKNESNPEKGNRDRASDL